MAFTTDLTYEHASGRGEDVQMSVQVSSGRGIVEEFRACDEIAISLDPISQATPDLQGTLTSGRQVITGDSGEGQIEFVDSETANEEADDGSGADDRPGFLGWYATITDPAQGEYVVTQDVVWNDGATANAGSGRLTLRLDIAGPGR